MRKNNKMYYRLHCPIMNISFSLLESFFLFYISCLMRGEIVKQSPANSVTKSIVKYIAKNVNFCVCVF
ncbi:Uncharacterized protein APZ42_015444 [Daphnia magna]|uniref:Uncharacterized protein n=1 Tax=Daphnia magna TaxID=35525 RepID=A0A0P6ARQ9_9CRUS|nr:Uncharacterized protein APZ42_015444 [Daphnia magna]